MTPERSRALRQLIISYAVTDGFVFALSRKTPMQFGLHELIGALFLVAALWSVRRDDDDTARYGIRLGGIFPGKNGDDRSLVRAVVESIPSAFRELGVAAGVALVVLPIYAFAWPYFNRVPPVRHFALDGEHMKTIATNLLAVALTEEMYFRGFVQTRLGDVFGVAKDLPLAKRLQAMALPILITSVLFAFTHVTVEPTIPRAIVFFPGLLFGAVRVWCGGIGAAVFLHALSNVFELWLEGK